MLIFSENGPSASALYKSADNRQYQNIRARTVKRAAPQRRSVKRKSRRKLTIKNVKFLKSLGFNKVKR